MTVDELERALFHWGAVIRGLERGTWEHQFALTVQRNARNPRWRPSPRQAAVIRNMITNLFAPTWADDEVIEREETAA